MQTAESFFCTWNHSDLILETVSSLPHIISYQITHQAPSLLTIDFSLQASEEQLSEENLLNPLSDESVELVTQSDASEEALSTTMYEINNFS